MVDPRAAWSTACVWMQADYRLTPGRPAAADDARSASTSRCWESVAAADRRAALVLAEPGGAHATRPSCASWSSAGVDHGDPLRALDAARPSWRSRTWSAAAPACAGSTAAARRCGRARSRGRLHGPPGGRAAQRLRPDRDRRRSPRYWLRGAGDAARVPIGRPIAEHARLRARPRLQPVPVGVPGELLHRRRRPGPRLPRPARLTAERFVARPVRPAGRRAPVPHRRPRAAGGPTATLEFLGPHRPPGQVRGFRIELGEIEAALPRTRPCARRPWSPREDTPGDQRLVAYVVADGGEPATAELRAAPGAQSLPEYMVPAAFVRLDALPLTPNGKVDRRRPARARAPRRADDRARPRRARRPRSAWPRSGREVLGLERRRASTTTSSSSAATRCWRPASWPARAQALGRSCRCARCSSSPRSPAGPRRRPAAREAGRSRRWPSRAGARAAVVRAAALWFLDQLGPGSAAYSIVVARCGSPASSTAGALARPDRGGPPARGAADARRASAGAAARWSSPPAGSSCRSSTWRGTAGGRAQRLAAEEAARPFDLDAGPLLRARALARWTTGSTCCCWPSTTSSPTAGRSACCIAS